jgi:hypothetical protein
MTIYWVTQIYRAPSRFASADEAEDFARRISDERFFARGYEHTRAATVWCGIDGQPNDFSCRVAEFAGGEMIWHHDFAARKE